MPDGLVERDPPEEDAALDVDFEFEPPDPEELPDPEPPDAEPPDPEPPPAPDLLPDSDLPSDPELPFDSALPPAPELPDSDLLCLPDLASDRLSVR